MPAMAAVLIMNERQVVRMGNARRGSNNGKSKTALIADEPPRYRQNMNHKKKVAKISRRHPKGKEAEQKLNSTSIEFQSFEHKVEEFAPIVE